MLEETEWLQEDVRQFWQMSTMTIPKRFDRTRMASRKDRMQRGAISPIAHPAVNLDVCPVLRISGTSSF